jgi:hypothetical protein
MARRVFIPPTTQPCGKYFDLGNSAEISPGENTYRIEHMCACQINQVQKKKKKKKKKKGRTWQRFYIGEVSKCLCPLDE